MSKMRVVITGLILGQRCQNVLHFDNPDGGLNDAQVRDEILANFVARLRNVQNAGLSYTELTVQKVDPPAAPISVFPLAGANGSLAGAAAPPVLAALCSIRTAVAGRHGHGRFYGFGVHGESVSNGAFQAGALAAWQGEANFIVGRFGSGGTGPLRLGVAPRSDPTAFITCTSIVVRATFGIQRRRNIGVGS